MDSYDAKTCTIIICTHYPSENREYQCKTDTILENNILRAILPIFPLRLTKSYRKEGSIEHTKVIN